MFTDQQKEHIRKVKQHIERLVENTQILKSKKSIIAGGVFYSLFHDTVVNDVDVFVTEGAETHETLVSGSVMQENTAYIKRSGPHVISVYMNEKHSIQTIYTTHKTREEVIRNFDFVHCCVSYDFNNLYISPETYDAIMNKKLIVNNPINAQQYRVNKFISRGFALYDRNENLAKVFGTKEPLHASQV